MTNSHTKYIEIKYQAIFNKKSGKIYWVLTLIRIDRGILVVFREKEFDFESARPLPEKHCGCMLEFLGKLKIDGGAVYQKLSESEYYCSIEIKPRKQYGHSG